MPKLTELLLNNTKDMNINSITIESSLYSSFFILDIPCLKELFIGDDNSRVESLQLISNYSILSTINKI